jgi:hypothetical protein
VRAHAKSSRALNAKLRFSTRKSFFSNFKSAAGIPATRKSAARPARFTMSLAGFGHKSANLRCIRPPPVPTAVQAPPPSPIRTPITNQRVAGDSETCTRTTQPIPSGKRNGLQPATVPVVKSSERMTKHFDQGIGLSAILEDEYDHDVDGESLRVADPENPSLLRSSYESPLPTPKRSRPPPSPLIRARAKARGLLGGVLRRKL